MADFPFPQVDSLRNLSHLYLRETEEKVTAFVRFFSIGL